MKAQIQDSRADAEYTVTIAQLRSELEQNRVFSDEASKLQAQQRLEIEKLKVALADETVGVENEREDMQKAFKER